MTSLNYLLANDTFLEMPKISSYDSCSTLMAARLFLFFFFLLIEPVYCITSRHNFQNDFTTLKGLYNNYRNRMYNIHEK